MRKIAAQLRNRIFDVSPRVTPVSSTVYDDPEVSRRYDSLAYSTQQFGDKASTFRSAYELEFLDYIEQEGVESILDIGCGCGAFYHLVQSVYPNRFRYRGIDVAPLQVSTAARNFGDGLFEVGDMTAIPDFRSYDVVHSYSIFSFIGWRKRLDVIERITRSSKLLLDTSFTLPDPRYAPRSVFRKFSGEVLTPIAFPYLDDLPTLPGHVVESEVFEYTSGLLINNGDGDSAVEPDTAERSGILQRIYKSIFPVSSLAVLVKIRPAGWRWTPQTEIDLEDADAIYACVMEKLRSAVA